MVYEIYSPRDSVGMALWNPQRDFCFCYKIVWMFLNNSPPTIQEQSATKTQAHPYHPWWYIYLHVQVPYATIKNQAINVGKSTFLRPMDDIFRKFPRRFLVTLNTCHHPGVPGKIISLPTRNPSWGKTFEQWKIPWLVGKYNTQVL